jgi:hypothetical protein
VTNEFDDPELERMLGRLSGAYPDTNVAYQAVHGRVRQVKRRRAFVAGTAACAMLFGVAAVAAQGVGPSQTVSPAAPADTSVVVTASSTPVATDAPTTSATDTSMVGTTLDTTPGTIVDTTAPEQGGGTASSTPGGTAAPTTSAVSSTTEATSPGNPTTTVTLPLGEHTWTSDGGSITVVNDNGVLTLVSSDPAAGFQEVRSDASSDRIRVEFSDGSTTWRIEIRTDGGKARAEITRHG